MGKNIPGSLYRRGKRWWWSVRKPGEQALTCLPMKPLGARFATTDKEVAEEIALSLWQKWTLAEAQEGGAPEKIRTMGDLCRAYLVHCREYYGEGGESNNIKYALRHVVGVAPDVPIEEFGPKALKGVREEMIESDLSRRVINQRVNMIRRMVRWAVSEELAPQSMDHALKTVAGLRCGHTRAREKKPVRAVDVAHVDITARYAPDMIADMIAVQRLIGCRPGELCAMRIRELEQKADIMLFRPEQHKTKWRGHNLVYAVGPRAGAILKRRTEGLGPFEYVFSPQRSEQERRKKLHVERKTPLSCGNRPGTNRKEKPKCKPGSFYHRKQYARAVQRAIRAARADGHDIPSWSPNQLRHTKGTEVRAQYDAEHAQTVLGHRHLSTTEIYAETALAKAIQVARETG